MLGHTVKSMYMLVIPGVTKVYYPWYDPCLMTSAVKPAPSLYTSGFKMPKWRQSKMLKTLQPIFYVWFYCDTHGVQTLSRNECLG